MKKKSVTLQEPSNTTEDTSTAQSTIGKAARKTIINLMLLALIATALVMLGLAWKQILGVMKHNNQIISTLQSEAMVLQATVKTQELALTEQQESLSQLHREMIQGAQTWTLAEVQYLVRLANFNLQTARNIPLSQSLLQAADKRVANLNDPHLLSLRKALAQDITNLQAQPQDDIAGLLLKLNALIEQVPALSLKQSPPPAAVTTSPTDTQPVPLWRAVLQRIQDKFKSLVIIHHQEDPLDAFTAAQNQVFADRYLQLLLQETAWSVLQRQDNLFKGATKQALSAIERFYAPEAPATKAMIATLTEISNVNVAFTAPDLTASLAAIQEAINHESTKPSQVASSEVPL